MYTQCPECSVAFRVTAEVLKMAGGNVRCGGCGVPFNALEHLSESKPRARTEADESSSLQKALDELPGDDVHIEDTGVEWRVVDSEDADGDDGPDPAPPQQPGGKVARSIDEMLFDDNTELPDDFDAVVEAPPTPKPVEALPPDEPEPEPEPEPPQFDLDLSEPEEWDDLIGDIEVLSEDGDDEPVETRDFEEADEIIEPEDELERSIEEDLLAAAFESESEARLNDDTVPGDAEEIDDDLLPDDVEIDLQADDDLESDDDIETIAMRFDGTIEEDIATLSESLDDDPAGEFVEEEVEQDLEADDAPDRESGNGQEPTPDEPVIPELTEEEKTINMLIDQELLSVAVEDEDGFASTIVQVQPDDKIEKEISAKDGGKKKSGKKDGDDSAEGPDADLPAGSKSDAPAMLVETIIMEGESIRAELDDAAGLADAAAGSDDGDLGLALNKEKDDYERRREMAHRSPRAGMIVGAAALVLVLLVQVVHQSRDALATMPVFNSAVGPVYRMLGMPLTPAWDIAGWRFEATKGDTDENGDILTIYSRVGNNSDEPLPYPLVHLSLTDRFEDIIGSTVLEPAEYLPENADPRNMVPPGNTFNAVIEIESPSPDATGFKLNVCYRLANEQLRCADHVFK